MFWQRIVCYRPSGRYSNEMYMKQTLEKWILSLRETYYSVVKDLNLKIWTITYKQHLWNNTVSRKSQINVFWVLVIVNESRKGMNVIMTINYLQKVFNPLMTDNMHYWYVVKDNSISSEIPKQNLFFWKSCSFTISESWINECMYVVRTSTHLRDWAMNSCVSEI